LVLTVTELRAGKRDGPGLALPSSLYPFAAAGRRVTGRRPFVRRGCRDFPFRKRGNRRCGNIPFRQRRKIRCRLQ
jgi:hypothetical protein